MLNWLFAFEKLLLGAKPLDLAPMNLAQWSSQDHYRSANVEIEYLTLGQTAKRLKCKSWQIGRLFERSILPEPHRLGNLRVIHVDQLERVEQALREVGYLPKETAVTA